MGFLDVIMHARSSSFSAHAAHAAIGLPDHSLESDRRHEYIQRPCTTNPS